MGIEVNIYKALSLTVHDVNPDDPQACHRLKKKGDSLLILYVQNRNEESLLTGRTSAISQILSHNLSSLIKFSFWKVCVMRTINCLLNIGT